MGNFAVMNNPFDYVPDARCDEAFRRLVDNLEISKEERSAGGFEFYS